MGGTVMRIKKFTAFAAALALAFGICGTVYAETSEDDFVIEYIGGEKYITEYRGSGGDIVIPDGIFGIGETAFQFNDNVTAVTFPPSCKKIDMMAFSWTTAIESVTFEGDMEDVGFMAFLGCTALEKVTFMGDIVSADSEDVFGGLAANAFMGCPKLKTVEFAEDSRIDIIKRAAFMDCASLTEVKLPREVGKICEYVFMNCPELTRLEIPSMTELEAFAAGYMYDEETEKEVKADGAASVRADMSFIYNDSRVADIVQKPLTLIVTEGSPAEEYAKVNGIACEYKPVGAEDTADEKNPVTGGNNAFPAAAAAFAMLAAAVFAMNTASDRKNSN